MQLPTYSVKTSRMLDLEDPLMRTVDTRYNDGLLCRIQDEDADTLVNLDSAVSGKVSKGRLRCLSLTTLVIDLALAAKHKMERLRLLRKEDELAFAVFTC